MDFDWHYQMFVKPPTLANIRTHMRDEHVFIHSKSWQKTPATSVHLHSDSDSGNVEVFHSPCPLFKLLSKHAHMTVAWKAKRPTCDSDDDTPQWHLSSLSSSIHKRARVSYNHQSHMLPSSVAYVEQVSHDLILKAKHAYDVHSDKWYISDSDSTDALSSPGLSISHT